MLGNQKATHTQGQAVKAIKALTHNYFLHPVAGSHPRNVNVTS